MKERVVYLDIIRLLAILMIILTHTPMPGLDTPGVVLSTISYLCAPGIGLFFMVSGALLLPVQQPMRAFYKKRFSKLLPPLLIWTVIYLTVSIVKEGVWDVPSLLRILASIPFSPQGSGTLWFVYTLVGLYLLAPVISPFLERAKKSEVEILLGLWVVTLLFPLLKNVVSINSSTYGVLYYFSGFAGYFVLGYYLNRMQTRAASAWLIVVLLLVPITAALLFRLFAVKVDFYEVFWYESVFVVSMCVGFFLLLKRCVHPEKISDKWRSRLAMLSNLSFGVYLIHFLVIRNVLWHWQLLTSYGGIAQIVLTFVIATILSFGLSWFISRLSFGDKIIGYKQKR